MLCDVEPEPNRLSMSNTSKLTVSWECERTGNIHEMEAFHLQKVKFSGGISLMTVVILKWVTLHKPITEFHVEGETFPDISTKVSFGNPPDIPQNYISNTLFIMKVGQSCCVMLNLNLTDFQ